MYTARTWVTSQRDGATYHTAESVTRWIKGEGEFPILSWRQNSPDLNPLDYSARGILEPNIFGTNPKPKAGQGRAI